MGRRIAVMAGIGLACLVACSKKEAPTAASQGLPEPASEPAPPPAASAAPTVVPPIGEPPLEAPATATAAPTTPTPTPLATQAPASKPVHASPRPPESTPSPDRDAKKVAVHANNRYACSGGERRESVVAAPEPHGARIIITGQGPCPGEVHDWAAEVNASRIEVHAAHGAPSKCRCSGTGDLVLRGLDPGTYDVHVNGGFDRPIATRVVVPQ